MREFLCSGKKDKRKIRPKDIIKMKRNLSGKYCNWIYREGIRENTHFAYTPCDPGFNFLSKCGRMAPLEVCETYTGTQCPICGRPVKMSFECIKTIYIQ